MILRLCNLLYIKCYRDTLLLFCFTVPQRARLTNNLLVLHIMTAPCEHILLGCTVR